MLNTGHHLQTETGGHCLCCFSFPISLGVSRSPKVDTYTLPNSKVNLSSQAPLQQLLEWGAEASLRLTQLLFWHSHSLIPQYPAPCAVIYTRAKSI